MTWVRRSLSIPRVPFNRFVSREESEAKVNLRTAEVHSKACRSNLSASISSRATGTVLPPGEITRLWNLVERAGDEVKERREALNAWYGSTGPVSRCVFLCM